jgi:hypothetical protein
MNLSSCIFPFPGEETGRLSLAISVLGPFPQIKKHPMVIIKDTLGAGYPQLTSFDPLAYHWCFFGQGITTALPLIILQGSGVELAAGELPYHGSIACRAGISHQIPEIGGVIESEI